MPYLFLLLSAELMHLLQRNQWEVTTEMVHHCHKMLRLASVHLAWQTLVYIAGHWEAKHLTNRFIVL